MTVKNPLSNQIEAYGKWKRKLIAAIEQFSRWVESQELENDSEISLRAYEAIQALKHDRLNLAFVAEFSRGKTELINALFFADYKCRLLPSDVGRTTMCPTELFYDNKEDSAYLKLLPIESRLTDRSIQDYKEEPIEWTRIPLPVNEPEQMQHILKEVVRTREVSIKKAMSLDLYEKELHPHLQNADPETTTIEIPMWRHAMISFPHPLLKQGLTILDTPGLNALGSEPELTMNMLPAAQAILFILAADTGVTKSDLEIWQHHIQPENRKNSRGIAVILNKIDTLWDELKSKQQIDQSIDDQIHKTSQLLGIKKEFVFPVSAQKGLLAKINNDELLLRRSQLDQVDKYLTHEVLPARESILRENIINSLGIIIEENQQVLHCRLEAVNKHLNSLRQLDGRNINIISQLMKKTRIEKSMYSQHIESYKSSSRLVMRQVNSMKNTLSLQKMDHIISTTRQSMVHSWTTNGMKKAMKELFTEVQEMTSKASHQVDTLHRLINTVYKKFYDEYGIKCNKPKAFKVKKYLVDLENLYLEAENYRKSPISTMSEQNMVIKRFFIQMVSQAREILFKSNQDLDNWGKDAMRPLNIQIRENKQAIEKHLKTLHVINDTKNNVEDKIAEMEAEHAQIKTQVDEINTIYACLSTPLPALLSSVSA